MDWYYRTHNEIHGPVPATVIVALVRERHLAPGDAVRAGANGHWRRVAETPALQMAIRRSRRTGMRKVLPSRPSFSAHWRGEQPLPDSFLLYFLIPVLVLQAVIFSGLQNWIPLPPTWLAVAVAIGLVLLPWQFIGVWRASEQHRRQYPSDSKPALAEAALVIVTLAVFAQAALGLPRLTPPVVTTKAVPAKQAPVAARIAAPAAKLAPPAPKPVIEPALSAEVLRHPVMAALDNQALFREFQRQSPEEFAQLRGMVQKAITEKLGEPAIWVRLDARLTELAGRWVSRAPEPQLTDYMQAVVKLMREMEQQDPAICTGFAYPKGRERAQRLDSLSDRAMTAERTALVNLILQSRANPQKPPAEAEVVELLRAAYAPLLERYGYDTLVKLEQPHQSGLDDAQLCRMTIEVYERFLTLPDGDRGRLLRYTLDASGSKAG